MGGGGGMAPVPSLGYGIEFQRYNKYINSMFLFFFLLFTNYIPDNRENKKYNVGTYLPALLDFKK